MRGLERSSGFAKRHFASERPSATGGYPSASQWIWQGEFGGYHYLAGVDGPNRLAILPEDPRSPESMSIIGLITRKPT